MFRHWRGAVSVAALGGRTLSSLPVHPVRGLQNMRLSSLPNKVSEDLQGRLQVLFYQEL